MRPVFNVVVKEILIFRVPNGPYIQYAVILSLSLSLSLSSLHFWTFPVDKENTYTSSAPHPISRFENCRLSRSQYDVDFVSEAR